MWLASFQCIIDHLIRLLECLNLVDAYLRKVWILVIVLLSLPPPPLHPLSIIPSINPERFVRQVMVGIRQYVLVAVSPPSSSTAFFRCFVGFLMQFGVRFVPVCF